MIQSIPYVLYYKGMTKLSRWEELNQKYKDKINPDFHLLCVSIPFPSFLFKIENMFQPIQMKLSTAMNGLKHKRIKLPGYQNLNLNVDIYEPLHDSSKLPCLFYLHGGGFHLKTSMFHRIMVCKYAKEAHCRVVLPNYHLIPRYPYPVAYEEIMSAYRWVCNNTDALKIDKTKIAVGGDSAGGELAALVCNTVEKNSLLIPCFQMLIYPVTDYKMNTHSMKEYTDTPVWNAVSNEHMWQQYLKNASDTQKREASPMDNVLPKHIPNTYIETTEYDCLHDEGVDYANYLNEHGANVVLNQTKGTMHAYDCAIKSKITKHNVAIRIQQLKEAFK